MKVLSILIVVTSSLLGMDCDPDIEGFSPDLECTECHHSSLIETTAGCFCAVWKGGPHEGKSSEADNRGIWFSHFDGETWSPPEEIVTSSNSICWSPVLNKMPSGEVVLSYRVGPDPRHVVSFIKRSYNTGLDWTQEEILPVGIIGFSKNVKK